MHDRYGLSPPHHVQQPLTIADVPPLERTEPHERLEAVTEVVVGHRQVAGPGEGLAGVTADVAGAAGHKDAGSAAVGHGIWHEWARSGTEWRVGEA